MFSSVNLIIMLSWQLRPSIELLLQTIFQKYLFSSYCLTIVSETGSEINMIPKVFTYIKWDHDINLKNKLLEVSEMGCSDYIIRMSEPEKFVKSFEEANKVATVRRSDRKLIFLPTNDNQSQYLLEILSMKEISYVANVLLVLKSSREDNCDMYNLVTHQFVGKTETQASIYLDDWNSCTNNFTRNANLFPHNMDDLKGKHLKVAAFTYKPYVLLDLDETTTPSGRNGFEMRIVDEFCR